MAMVGAGEVHPHPAGCPGKAYTTLLPCWKFEAAARPTFAELLQDFRRLAKEGAHNDNRHVHLVRRWAARLAQHSKRCTQKKKRRRAMTAL